MNPYYMRCLAAGKLLAEGKPVPGTPGTERMLLTCLYMAATDEEKAAIASLPSMSPHHPAEAQHG